jgi:hypothetical protein
MNGGDQRARGPAVKRVCASATIQQIMARLAGQRIIACAAVKGVFAQIAQKNIDIERKNGEAAGARSAAQAIEQAKAITSISAVLSPSYIQYLQAENIKGADRVYVPMNAGPQLVMPIKEKAGKAEAK